MLAWICVFAIYALRNGIGLRPSYNGLGFGVIMIPTLLTATSVFTIHLDATTSDGVLTIRQVIDPDVFVNWLLHRGPCMGH